MFLVLIQDKPDEHNWSKEHVVLSSLHTKEEVEAEWSESGKILIIYGALEFAYLDEWPIEFPVDEELDH